MTWLTRLNPTPAFPPYTGPYKVGSADVEIPTAELGDEEKKQPTVAFRVFYPCLDDGKAAGGVRWLPSPQREFLGAYARFLGAGNAFSQMFSLIPQLLYYITIPVHANAEILEPATKSKRWPVMVFSHGLGGSRNAYSHICGSLASHGMVVFAPDHRDGSAPISFIHTPDEKEKLKKVEYKRVAHKASTEVYEARDEQLKTRLWEMNLVHEAILKLDAGKSFKNVAEGQKKDPKDLLSMFASKLAVHEPGSIAFAGHSFGAATTVQFVKSVFYRPTSPVSDYTPLFTPSDSSPLIRQITPSTPIALLDLWTLPLHSPHTSYLRSKPMPCYASPQGGKNLIAILSEAFYKWTANLNDTKRAIAKPPGSDRPGPHIFYPVASAHLSQSDFGVLFPWVTTKIFGAKEPERVLRLNARAVLQVLREAGVEVADTRVEDLELELEGEVKLGEDVRDERILSRKGQGVRGWVSLSAEPEPEERETSKGPGDAVVEGEVLGEVVTERERSET